MIQSSVPTGVWHWLLFHIIRHESNGLADAFYNGVRKVHKTGVVTRKWQKRYNINTCKAHNQPDESLKKIYFDDLLFFNSLTFPNPLKAILYNKPKVFPRFSGGW
ncbi:MAG: hypothetical protein ACFFDT_27645 [Candidatus Hodarchaeota archaeon]